MMNTDCILYAEDDSHDACFLHYAFAEAGIPNPLQIVCDGQEAIDYLTGTGEFADRLLHPMPCLVLLDLKMPRKTGMEVLEWIRAQPNLRHLPVIIFSASAQPSDVEKAYLFGANSYVIKPVSMEEKIEFAETIRSYWLHFHHPPPSNL